VVVALIDDDAGARTATGGMLESWGCRVLAADCAAALLGLCDALGARPQLAICDYRLRDGETGVGVADRLRARFGMALPCILVSGDTDATLVRQAAEHKLPLLHKPVRPAKLRSLLQRLLASGP
jgi:CheY-like chemotaxis protein